MEMKGNARVLTFALRHGLLSTRPEENLAVPLLLVHRLLPWKHKKQINVAQDLQEIT